MAIDKEKILDIAQKYILKGQSKKAIKEYLKLVEANPQDKRLHLKLGDLYLKNGEQEKAIQAYLKVASLYGEEDLNFRAISIYKKILSIDPKSIEAFQRIAELYLKEGLAGSAKNYYQSILEIDPHHSEALKAIEHMEGNQQAREGGIPLGSSEPPLAKPLPSPGEKSFDENAVPLSPPGSETAISAFDKDAEMHYHLGIAYKEMELFDYAITEFELASSSPPIRFDCYIMLGNCYMEKGDYNKSIDYFKMSSEIQGLSNERLARLHFQLGLAYEANRMIPEAIDTFTLVLKLDQSFPGAKEKLEKLQRAQND